MNCGLLGENNFNCHPFFSTALKCLFLTCECLQVEKNVFVVFYSGEKAKTKILKICEAFGANRYPFTEDFGKQILMISEVRVVLLSDVSFSFLYDKLQVLLFSSPGTLLLACFFSDFLFIQEAAACFFPSLDIFISL